ncbi:SURF1 family cytochrome oxidase biogenesis protein [Streptomyces sp. enrichment culture]|uniref:SURF1 family cytochrome oxidase biogenesis protein n=1 Tax=Streptomyces sp. enrichment culture TaxID=1795815 RepID=UPI003F56D43C
MGDQLIRRVLRAFPPLHGQSAARPLRGTLRIPPEGPTKPRRVAHHRPDRRTAGRPPAGHQTDLGPARHRHRPPATGHRPPATGHHDAQFLVPGRKVNGRTGFYVLTLLRTGHDGALPVVRGWLPGHARTAGIPAPPAGDVTVTGILQPAESRGSPGAQADGGATGWGSSSPRPLRGRGGAPKPDITPETLNRKDPGTTKSHPASRSGTSWSERRAGLAPASPRRKRGVFPWTTNAVPATGISRRPAQDQHSTEGRSGPPAPAELPADESCREPGTSAAERTCAALRPPPRRPPVRFGPLGRR